MSWYRRKGPALILTLRIQPGASHSGFAGLHDGALKIRINAPPVEGRANRELIDFLATVFGCAKANVVLLRGESGRTKVVRIHGPTRIPADIVGLAPELAFQ